MRPIRFFLSALCLTVLMCGCNPKEDEVESQTDLEYVNSWILKTMGDYYYWCDKLPQTTDKKLAPADYFESILYRYNAVTAPDGDRFSWIEEDYKVLQGSLNGVVPNEIGFDISLYYKDASRTTVIGQINYVKKGTPAQSSGLKRGMVFNRVNGTVMTASNYSSLLNTTSADVTIGFCEPIYDSEGAVLAYLNTTEKTIQTVANYSENPVYMDTVLVRDNHKIGYFVYNFFSPDNGVKANAYQYDLEMNSVFGRFKTAGITDLVLDLRYNSGGHTSSAQLLASEVVPSLSESNLFAYYRYNKELNAAYVSAYGTEALKTYFTTTIKNGETVLGSVNNIGSQLGGTVYILTGPYTASASEQIINGLNPYMNVILVGDTTFGKNVASITLWDEDNTDRNKWGMQPIVAKYFNSLGKSDFTSGFAPNYVVRDGGLNMKEFGDPSESLLGTALQAILGTSSQASVQKRSLTVHSDKQLGLPTKRIRGMQLDKLPFFK